MRGACPKFENRLVVPVEPVERASSPDARGSEVRPGLSRAPKEVLGQSPAGAGRRRENPHALRQNGRVDYRADTGRRQGLVIAAVGEQQIRIAREDLRRFRQMGRLIGEQRSIRQKGGRRYVPQPRRSVLGRLRNRQVDKPAAEFPVHFGQIETVISPISRQHRRHADSRCARHARGPGHHVVSQHHSHVHMQQRAAMHQPVERRWALRLPAIRQRSCDLGKPARRQALHRLKSLIVEPGDMAVDG